MIPNRFIRWPATFAGRGFWFVACLACALVCRGEEKKDPVLELAFKLRDSSSIRGAPTIEKMPFQSALVEMEIPLAMLSNVEFKDNKKTAILYFQNGDRLEGVFRSKTMGVKTAYGKLEVDLCEIVSFQVCGARGGDGGVPPEGLVGHWPLDDNANDASGNGHHGKVDGATPTQGVFGRAYHFDGNACIDLGPLDFSSEQFTVSGWIRTDEPAQTECWRNWIDKLDASTGPFQMGLADGQPERGNGAHVAVWRGGRTDGDFYSRDLKQNLRDGRWHMFSFTWQSGSQHVYVDGRECASGTVAGPFPHSHASVKIGGHRFGSYHRPWIGDVAKVLIYSRVLTREEIARLFQTQRFANTSNPP